MEELQSLEEVYPDIADELENRHSSHHGELKRRFSKTYSDFEPQFFVSAKGLAHLFEVTGTSLAVSMALQNGTVVALSSTNPQRDVYINTPEFDEEIVLSCKGEVKQGNSPLAQMISEVYQLALDNAVVSKLMGGIIYFDVTIQPYQRGYSESIRMAFALTALTINNLLKSETINELQHRIFGPTMPAPYSLYSNLGLVYGNHETRCQSLKLANQNFTFLVCDVDGEVEQTAQPTSDMEEELETLEAVAESYWKVRMAEEKPLGGKMGYLVGLLERNMLLAVKSVIKEGSFTVNQYQKMLGLSIHPQRLIDRNKLLNLGRRLATFLQQYQQLICLIKQPTKDRLRWALNTNQRLLSSHSLISPKTLQLMKMCEQSGALACTVVDHRFLLILCDKSKMLYLFDGLKKELFWKTSPQSEQTLQVSSSTIRRKVFSTLPSTGCGVLNPAQEMWFM